MELFDIRNIAERDIELINPSSPEKLVRVGEVLRLREGSKVIDFGCGFGEMLALWADQFGIVGIGIDVRPYACERARAKMKARGFAERIEIACASGSEYEFEPVAYDVAVCLGASFIWGGFRPTIAAMKRAIKPGGQLVIGEPYWLHSTVPPQYAIKERFHNESELLSIIREEGFDLMYVLHSSVDEWDRYESDNWVGLIRWLEENQDHPEREEVIWRFHQWQEEYLTHGREYLGWGIYVLCPSVSCPKEQ